MKRVLFILLSVIAINSYAIDGFVCDRSDGEAVLTAEFLNESQAGVSEIEGNLGWAVTANYVRQTINTKPTTAITRFYLDNGGVLKVFEFDYQKLGVLMFQAGEIALYDCESF